MRKGGAWAVAATLAARPLVVFGRNVVFPTDPVGMKLYQAHHLTETLALSIVACAFALGFLLHLARRKPKSTAEKADAWFYDI